MPAGGHFRSRQNMFRYLIDQMRTILNLVLLGWVRIATSLATNARREQVADEETVFFTTFETFTTHSYAPLWSPKCV